MSQGPFKVDALQVEPAMAGTRSISADVSTELKFIDPLVPSGLKLSQLAGLRTVTGVLVVGRAGTGAQYTAIQTALDAVPTSASLTNPYVVVVLPGVYAENLTLNRAGVTLMAWGRVVVSAVTATPALKVIAGGSSTPTSGAVVGVTFAQSADAQSCVAFVGGASSTVAADGFLLERCTFVSTGTGGFALNADTVGVVEVRACSAVGSVASTLFYAKQCTEIRVVGGDLPLVQLDYDTALPRPSVTTSTYSLVGCRAVGNVLSTLVSAGSLTVSQCSTVGSVTMSGNRTVTLTHSTVGAVTLNGTTAGTAHSLRRGALAGAGTWTEPQLRGATEFTADSIVAVTFDLARVSADYVVLLDPGANATPWVTAKTAAGFTINFATSQTLTVGWAVFG